MDDLKNALYKIVMGITKPQPKLVLYDNHLEEILEKITPLLEQYSGNINPRWLALRMIDGDKKLVESLYELIPKEVLDKIHNILNEQTNLEDKQAIRDCIATKMYSKVEYVTESFVKTNPKKANRDRIIDNYITSKRFGIPLMLLTLAIVFWITISGANYPSAMLSDFFVIVENKLTLLFQHINAPAWLHGLLILGLFRTFLGCISHVTTHGHLLPSLYYLRRFNLLR